MALSSEMQRLERAWQNRDQWRRRLEWLQIEGVRGWTGQKIELRFPIMAITGENGSGKSTVLQCAAAVYRQPPPSKTQYASEFFPSTAWESVRNVRINYLAWTGNRQDFNSIRKPTSSWRGNPDRPERNVTYIDLTRITPVAARVGYSRLAKSSNPEQSNQPFSQEDLDRMTFIMGRQYESAKMSKTTMDNTREVPVLKQNGNEFSGFHQGAGETTIAELYQNNIPEHSLLLIDEIESSLHPRAQRRLVQSLANLCRLKHLQIILTTHSPFVLQELPTDARIYIMNLPTGKELIYAVSPEFAMTSMDEHPHPECDVFVEDLRASTLLTEIVVSQDAPILRRCQIIPFGSADGGKALGRMVAENRLPRRSVVFLDGDQTQFRGCHLLPGTEAPEVVVFGALADRNWGNLSDRVGRMKANVIDACARAMTGADHHTWVVTAASELSLGGDSLWQAMCAEYTAVCLPSDVAKNIVTIIDDAINGITPATPAAAPPAAATAPGPLPDSGAATPPPAEAAAATAPTDSPHGAPSALPQPATRRRRPLTDEGDADSPLPLFPN